jgi:DNA-binding Xre family transcriptional regulator
MGSALSVRPSCADQLERFLRDSGTSQRSLAARARISQARISRLLHRKAWTLKLDEAERLAAEMGVPLSDIVQVEPEQRSWQARVVHPLTPARRLVGREEILRRLVSWGREEAPQDRVVGLIGVGGVGKTALAERFLRDHVSKARDGGTFVWSFHDDPRPDAFLRAACAYFTGEKPPEQACEVEHLREALRGTQRHLLVLDGLERVQVDGGGRTRGEIEHRGLRLLLRSLALGLGRTRALVTSRLPLRDIEDWADAGYRMIRVGEIDRDAARSLLVAFGVHDGDRTIESLVDRAGGHALLLVAFASCASELYGGDARRVAKLDLEKAAEENRYAGQLKSLLTSCNDTLCEEERTMLAALSDCGPGADTDDLIRRWSEGAGADAPRRDAEWALHALSRLRARGLVVTHHDDKQTEIWSAHPLVREGIRLLVAGAGGPTQER